MGYPRRAVAQEASLRTDQFQDYKPTWRATTGGYVAVSAPGHESLPESEGWEITSKETRFGLSCGDSGLKTVYIVGISFS